MYLAYMLIMEVTRAWIQDKFTWLKIIDIESKSILTE